MPTSFTPFGGMSDAPANGSLLTPSPQIPPPPTAGPIASTLPIQGADERPPVVEPVVQKPAEGPSDSFIDSIISELNDPSADADPPLDTPAAPAPDKTIVQPPATPPAKPVKPPHFSDPQFWVMMLRGLRDPLIVGMVVALVASPRIQRRLGEFIPFAGETVQSHLLRVGAAVVLYIAISRLIAV